MTELDERRAVNWLRERGWHVTDLRVRAVVSGVDLTALGCELWSDGGPCATCVDHALSWAN